VLTRKICNIKYVDKNLSVFIFGPADFEDFLKSRYPDRN